MGNFIIILIVLIIALLAVGILNKFAKYKPSNLIMLLGIETTLVGVALILLSDSMGSEFIVSILGLILVGVGFAVNIYGFINE
ncbi:MAG: hypothetical protein GX958_01190 [Desulfitobacterium sp.]|nr:hypothetical protein [Desulfitobacterium sp.]